MGGWRSPVGALAAAILLAASPGAAEAFLDFQGRLVSADPLRLRGELGYNAPNGTLELQTGIPPSAAVGETARATLHVAERRYHRLDLPGDVPAPKPPKPIFFDVNVDRETNAFDQEQPSTKVSNRILYRLEATVVGVHGSLHWLDIFAAGQTRLGRDAECNVKSEDRSGVGFHGYPVRPPRPTERWLDARCTTSGLGWNGTHTLYVFNTTMELLYANGPGLEPTHFETLDTGTFSRPNETNPARTDVVERMAWFYMEGGEVAVDFPAPVEARLRTPHLIAVGSVEVPPANGTVVWGRWVRSPLNESLQPEGSFDLQPWESQGVRVSGATLNGPPDMRTAARVAPPESAAPWVLAAPAVLILGVLAWRLAPGVAALFTRLSESTLLDHPRRRRVHDAVLARGGLTFMELVQVLGIARQAAAFHTRVLQRHRLVTIQRMGGRVWVFPPGRPPDPSFGLLRKPFIQRLIRVLGESPSHAQACLAERLGVDQSYVSMQLGALERAGLVRREGGRRTMRYVVLPTAGV